MVTGSIVFLFFFFWKEHDGSAQAAWCWNCWFLPSLSKVCSRLLLVHFLSYFTPCSFYSVCNSTLCPNDLYRKYLTYVVYFSSASSATYKPVLLVSKVYCWAVHSSQLTFPCPLLSSSSCLHSSSLHPGSPQAALDCQARPFLFYIAVLRWWNKYFTQH